MKKNIYCIGRFVTMLLLLVSTTYGEVILKTNFTENMTPVKVKSQKITGEVPAGWSDNSSWADLSVKYSKETFQNDNYLKITLDKRNTGFVQFRSEQLPDAEDNTVYRLNVTLRNRSEGQIRIGFRSIDAPYSYYWSVTDDFSKDWKDYSYTFKLKKTQPMGMWFCLNDLGSLELAKLELIRMTEAETEAYYEKLASQYPPNGPANLLRSSRFPLGLQSGMSIFRNSSGDEVVINSESDGTAPSGLPVLTINSRRKEMLLIGEPFKVVFPNRPHTCRIKIKGEGDFLFQIKHQKESYLSKNFKLKSEHWQTLDLPFNPDAFSQCYQLLIKGKGTLKIDSIKIKSTQNIDSKEINPEVALAVPESPVSVSRIQFASMPTEINYCVTSLLEDALLKGEVTNLYGETKTLPAVSLKAGKIFYGKIDYNLFSDKPLGSFRINAWLEKDGEIISPINELVVTRMRKPRYWGKDAPHSSFGAHLLPHRRSLTLAKASGINWTRLHDAGLEYIGWWKLEPEKGKWQFFDEEIKRYRDQGLMIFGQLGTAPKWASYHSKIGRYAFTYFDKYFQPVELDDYRNYVKTVCERYKNDIAAFDVWNEPWIHAWWGVDYEGGKEDVDRSGFKTSKEPQKDFVNLTKSAYYTAKLVDSKIKIAGFNTSSTPISNNYHFSGTQWTDGVLKNDGLKYCDVLAYHAYNVGHMGFPGDLIEKGLQTAFGPVFEKNKGQSPKPIWMTEGSPFNEIGNGLYKHTLPFETSDDYDRASNDIVRYMMSLMANNVERHFLYSLHCHSGMFAPLVQGARMLTNIDGYPHPSAVAHSNFAYLIEDTKFSKRLKLAEGVYAYIFSGSGRTVACISTKPEFDEYTISVTDKISAIDLYGNRIEGELKAGKNLSYLSGNVSVEEMTNFFDKNK